MIFWKKLSTAGNTCRHDRLLKGIRHQISKFHFYVLWVFVSSSTWYGLEGENTRTLAKRFKPFHAVKEIFTNISCMSSFVIKCGIGTCFGHKGPQNLKILRIYQTGSLTRDIIYSSKCAKIQKIQVRPQYIQCFIAWLEERSVIEVRYNHIGNCLPVVQR